MKSFKQLAQAGLATLILVLAAACVKKEDKPVIAPEFTLPPFNIPSPVAKSAGSDDLEKKFKEISTYGDEKLKDIAASGGKPGKIYLKGDFLNEDGKLDPRIEVTQTPGFGWRGNLAEVPADALQVSGDIEEERLQKLEEAAKKKTVVDFGCSIDQTMKELKDLEIEEVQPAENGAIFVSAKLVWICDLSKFADRNISIIADKVVLNYLQVKLTSKTQFFSILANQFGIQGINEISAKAEDGTSTLMFPAMIELSAKELLKPKTGKMDAFLSIVSEGASYAPSKAPATAPAP